LEKAASMHINEVFDDLKTSINGLTTEDAKVRLRKYGQNKLLEKRQIPLVHKFVRHLRDLFGVLLIVASILSYISGNPDLALIILAVVSRVARRESYCNPEKLDARVRKGFSRRRA
jgi:magnesium-transporting ATPase (P-type)